MSERDVVDGLGWVLDTDGYLHVKKIEEKVQEMDRGLDWMSEFRGISDRVSSLIEWDSKVDRVTNEITFLS